MYLHKGCIFLQQQIFWLIFFSYSIKSAHNWWQDVCKGSSAYKGKPAILDDKNLNKPKDEKESPKIKLQQFSSDSLVYYFHPVAFVEAMRRIGNKYVCKHISYKQAIYSDTAVKNNINNEATEEHIYYMQYLGVNVFDPLFEHFNGKIRINNMYRSAELNLALKKAGYAASKTSQHMFGQAVDIDALPPYTNRDIFKYIVNNLEFDQIIWESGTDKNPDWVHVSYNPKGNRMDKKQFKNKKYIPFKLEI